MVGDGYNHIFTITILLMDFVIEELENEFETGRIFQKTKRFQLSCQQSKGADNNYFSHGLNLFNH